MMLDISEEQARELDEVLEAHTRALLVQIDKAFDRSFKAELRARYERLEGFRAQLRLRVTGSEAYA